MRDSFAGVLFDKDGTLIDLHASWVRAGLATASLMCEQAGTPDRFDDLLIAAGYDPATGSLGAGSAWASGRTRCLVELWAEALGLESGDRLIDDMLEHMTTQAAAHITPLADLSVLFAELRGSGLRLGVATMDLEDATHSTLARLGVSQALDFVCGCDSGHGEKPSPGMVLAFCDACGLAPHQVMVVGDTPHDLHMARAAGAGKVVGVTSGASGAELLAPLADHVIANVTGVLDLLDACSAQGPRP